MEWEKKKIERKNGRIGFGDSIEKKSDIEDGRLKKIGKKVEKSSIEGKVREDKRVKEGMLKIKIEIIKRVKEEKGIEK